MRHLTGNEIVRLVARELSVADAEAARSHLDSCPACAAHVREQEATWTALGAWEIGPARDITAGVLARVDHDERSAERARLSRGTRHVQVWRIAASVLIAAGVGHTVGRWSTAGSETSQSETVAATSEDVVETLGLDVLASAPVGLDDVIDGPEDESARQEDRS